MTNIRILFISILLSAISFGQKLKPLEIPTFGSNDTIVNHTGYSVSYNTKFRQANWVAYMLTSFETNGVVKRNDKFIADPLIKKTNNRVDYDKSGYDRGHLAPAADMLFSDVTMRESFYFSNMSAQLPGFNRGVWKVLEGQVRNWAIEYDSLYIVVGPVYSEGMKLIGPDNLAVPNSYYKIILDNHTGKEKMIGFLMKNEKSSNSLQSFVVPVDKIEALTGIDFYNELPDVLENKLESVVLLTNWSFPIIKEQKPKK
jgi:endonuclease G